MPPATVTSLPLKPIKARGLVDDVYDTLIEMLIAGALPPGTPLSIDRLSREFGVSPTPVREALAQITPTGLVERTTNRGYRVAPPMSPNQMVELAEARLVLECGALERAFADRDALVRDMKQALDRHAEAAETFIAPESLQDYRIVHAYFIADWAFHQTILDHCGNRYINRSCNALSFSVHRMRQTLGADSTDAPIAVAEHRTIYEAIAADNLEKATTALTKHLRAVALRSQEDPHT